ncbi:MAG: PD-(D/E)XK nuclease family transposase [Spirulinaceae cyanobacterium]
MICSPNLRIRYKKLFGEEPNKDLLLDFLNELLKDKEGESKSINVTVPAIRGGNTEKKHQGQEHKEVEMVTPVLRGLCF